MFDLSYVISLPKRWDRYRQFLMTYPLSIQRFDAIDGEAAMPPDWWKAGTGAWGCYRSHLTCIEMALNQNVENVAIFEDDCEFPLDFTERLKKFMYHLPDNWDMLYLGGQLLHTKEHTPKRLNAFVYRPFEVHRSHAYVIRKKFLHTIYHHLLSRNWLPWEHIDHHYGKLCRLDSHNVYCPHRWLAKQSGSYSDIRQIEWKLIMPDPFTFDSSYRTVVLYFSSQPSHIVKIIQILDPKALIYDQPTGKLLEVPRLISIDGSLEDVDIQRLNPSYLEVDSQEVREPDALVLRLARYLKVKDHNLISEALKYAKENTQS